MEKQKKTEESIVAKRTVRYTFRLTEAQDIELKRLMEAAGCAGNVSRYIVGRILN